MAEFDTILRCTLGGASFQLSDYGYRSEPILLEGKGRVGLNLTASGEGYVQAADPAAFAAAVGAVGDAMRVSGQNFEVFGLGGASEMRVVAAKCLDGGPHVAFEVLPQGDGAALVKRFRFTLAARMFAPTMGGGDPGEEDPPPEPVTDLYSVRSTTRADGLRQVSVRGDLRGPGAAAFFEARVRPFFDAKYPPLTWVSTYALDANLQDNAASYTFDFAELKTPLPRASDGMGVDGEMTIAYERDEQMRLVTTYRFDFLVRGDAERVLDLVRQEVKLTPLRERYEVTRHKEVRLRGEIQLLAGGDGSGLLNWERSLTLQESWPGTLDVQAMPGTRPLFVARPAGAFVYVDAGRAVGSGVFPKPPKYLHNITTFAADDEVAFLDVSPFEKQTTWKYTYLLDWPMDVDGRTLAAALARPAKPEFLL